MSTTREDVAAKRGNAINSMVSSLRNGEDRAYDVGLTGYYIYYIEGIPYSASGLSVDLSATQNIRQTDVGFSCTAMFPPTMLQSSTVKANGISTKSAGRSRKL